MKANLITLSLLGVAVFALGSHARDVEWTGLKVAAAIFSGISLVLLIVARLQLGGSFSLRAKAKRLVTTGVYSRIRNPIYVFGALFIVGMSVVLEKPMLLLLVGVLIPVQAYRARKEEAVLAAAFGEEYARYKAGTWF